MHLKRGQRDMAKAAPNDPAHTAEFHRVTDRQTDKHRPHW